MTTPLKFAIALVLLSCAGGLRDTRAAEYFLSPRGDDQASGATPRGAWRSLAHAIPRLSAGDTLSLLPGEYVQQAAATSLAGRSDAPITIRAVRPGEAVLRAAVRLPAARPVGPGVWRIPPMNGAAWPVHRLGVVGIGAIPNRANNADDILAQCWQQAEDGTVTLQLPGDDLTEPTVEVVALRGEGLRLENARHVILDGLAFHGHDTALLLKDPDHVEVRDCVFTYCEQAVVVQGGQHVTIRNNVFREVQARGAGITVTDGQRHQVLGNRVLGVAGTGVRMEGSSGRWQIANNILRHLDTGIDIANSAADGRVERNVVDGRHGTLMNLPGARGPRPQWNTLISATHPAHHLRAGLDGTNLVQGSDTKDAAGFCDPANLDYRLQADSRWRGTADGEDPGAYPYRGNVIFVSPDGDDDRDGLSVRSSLRTLAQAAQLAGPGVTVYLMPGEHRAPLTPMHDGRPDEPIRFVGHGEAGYRHVRIVGDGKGPGINLINRSHIQVSNVRVAEAHTGVVLAQSRSCVVERCHFDRPHVSGAVILDAIDVRVHHVTVWDSVGPAVILQGNLRNVDVVSCLLRGHRLALGVRSDSTPGQAWRTDRNVYVTTRHGAGGDTDRSGAAPQIVGVSAAQVNGTTAGTADALRAITEGDGRSVIDDRSVNLSQASRAATGGGIGMPPTGVGAIDN